MNKEELEYLNLLSKILNGNERSDRTGVGTYSVFGTQLRFSLENGKIPMLTTKKMFARGVIEELLFFLRGDTDTKKLEAKGVNIWKGNTTREFLDKRGLTYLPEGDMGKGYGFQWRNFDGDDKRDTEWSKTSDPIVKGTDQIKKALHMIKNDPNSRKIIVSAWNPNQLNEMALEPCHCFFQFEVNDGELSCQWYQRSVDTFLGLPFNILSYAILTHMFAKASGLKAKELIFCGGNTHLYKNHINQAKLQISRTPYDFPTLEINQNISSIEDMEKLSFDNFEIIGYQSHPAIKADMAI